MAVFTLNGSHPAYLADSIFYFICGIGYFLFGMSCVVFYKLRLFEMEKVKFLQKYAMSSVIISGAIMCVWHVDNRGFYGIYNVLSLAFLKDSIGVMLCSSGVLYTHSMYVFVMTSFSHKRSAMENKWIAVGIPTIVLILADIVSTLIAYRIEHESPRQVFYFLMMTVCFLTCAGSVFTLKIVRDFQENRKATSGGGTVVNSEEISKVKGRLFRASAGLGTAGVALIYIMISTSLKNRTLTASVTPTNRKVYEFYLAPAIHVVLVAVAAMYAWVPLKRGITLQNCLSEVNNNRTRQMSTTAHPSKAYDANNSVKVKPIVEVQQQQQQQQEQV